MSELMAREPTGARAVREPITTNIWIDDYLDQQQSEFARYGRIILKRRGLVIGVALAVFAAMSLWTFTSKRMYSSSVNIQIDAEQSVLPYRDMYVPATADPTYLRTQAQVLKSEALMSRVVTKLGLESDPAKVSSLARWMAGNVVVAPIEGTQVVKVSFQSEDPEFAARAVNALADDYVDYGFEVKRIAMFKARAYIEEELDKLKRKLEQSEQRLVNYGRQHQILLPSEDNNVIRQKLADLNQELTKVEAEVIANQYASLRTTTLDNYPEKLKTSVMRSLDTRRSELEQKLATVTSQFGPKWPEVRTLTQELNEVRQQLASEKQKALDQAKVEYDLAVAHRARLTAALNEQSRLADNLTQASIEYNILKREVETDRQLHEGLLQRLKETGVALGLKSGNVHIIDRGHVPRLPSTPNVPLNLALGLVFGLISGVAVASAVDLVHRTIKTPEDVERELRVAFLGAIPEFSKPWAQATGGHLMPLTLPGEAQPDGNAVPQHVNSGAGIYWESYRALRTSLLFSSPETRPHTILMTSAVPGEGKTTTAVNLAIALAQTGARTLILELDMRRPQLAALFDLRTDRGMSRYLSGQSRLNTEIQDTGVPNLFVVPAGPIPPNPPELLGSQRLQAALQLMQRYFEFIVVDGPPLLPVTDAAVISSQVDGVVLVVGGDTSTSLVQRARNLLRSVDARIIGALVNNVKMDRSQHYYASYHS
jgi:capsular exopolysaccharide synthesis family protein